MHLTDHRLRPGEALAVGMALDLTYSRLIGLLRRDDWERVLDLLEALGLVLYAPELSEHLDQPGHPRCVLHGLRGLREPLPAGSRPTITLLERIGRAVEVDAVDKAVYARAVGVLRGRAEREARYARQRTAV